MCRVYDVNKELKYKEYSSKLACESSCNSNTDEQRRCLWDNIIIRERPSDEAKKSNSMKEYGEYLGETPLYEFFQAVAYEVKIKSKHTCNEMNRIEKVDASCKNIVDFLNHLKKLNVVPLPMQKKILLCKCIDAIPNLETEYSISCPRGSVTRNRKTSLCKEKTGTFWRNQKSFWRWLKITNFIKKDGF